MSKHKPRVLIVSHDVVGTQMAGPGIRYYHMARVLAGKFSVTLAAPVPLSLEGGRKFETLPYNHIESTQLDTAIRQSDVVFVPALLVGKIPALRQNSSLPVIIDAYDPFVVETLARGVKDVSALQQDLAKAYLRGDFFICASERQRDWLLGVLEAFGRVNASTFVKDATLRQLVDVVPYGLPDGVLQHNRWVIKGVWHNISREDYVILWGGGLWKWLDPFTAIKAIYEIWQTRQDVRLVFPGTKHPNKNIPDTLTHNVEAKRLAEKLNLLNRAVFFGDWIPYKNWQDVLFESDIALTLHYDTIETHFSYRSRVLEYIMAELPIITTQGSVTSELVQDYGLGYVVEYQDVDGVANALHSLLSKLPDWRQTADYHTLKEQLAWRNILRPVEQFCKNPRLAADKGQTLGNPFYIEKISRLENKIQQYERGKFIRFMRWVKTRLRVFRLIGDRVER